jgi:tetratricopeptide (TPR) repeat protein/tRNA A-37 threonylcarbamoyl transferase component Bud32
VSIETIGDPFECLGPETLARALEGLAHDPDRAMIEAHLARCSACREVLAAAAETGWGKDDSDADTLPSPTDRASDGEVLPPGARVGRYVVIRVEARGGMGIVYEAHDPELNRKVALKLLRRDRVSDNLRSEYEDRLRREAQSLAQLAHPNVVAAYDVGHVDGQIFVAMEWVEGSTLTRWLNDARRPWREILGRFLQAGRGLRAAHDAGLVHRDFKPENVLIGGDDRVRVADFGLARLVASSSDGGDQLALSLTAEGLRLGTPVYMSPEQLRGEPVDEKSDQFSFCVALYSGLYGQLPFEGVDRAHVREAPRGSRVPRRVHRALMRGMAAARADRFPSMAELLDALERVPRWRRPAAFAAAVILVVGSAAGVQQWTDAGRLCRGAERKLAGAWDGERRAAIERALIATGAPYARTTFREVARAFDGFSQSWVAMHTEACEATRVRGDQTEEILGLRMSCLDRRLREMRALGDRFLEADVEVAQNAVRAVQRLSDLSACSDLAALTAPVPPPSDEETLARVEAIDEELARVQSFAQTGRYRDGLPHARALAVRARDVGHRPIEAESFHLLGVFADEMGEYEEAKQSLDRAVWAAEAGRHDEVAALAWIRTIRLLGERLGKNEEARALAPRVTAALERIGGDEEIEASLRSVLASIALMQGGYADAERDFALTLELLERRFGPDDLRLTEPLRKLAFIAAHRDESEESLALLQRALAIQKKVYDDHPEIATTLETIASAEYMAGRYPEAEQAFLRALEIRERTLGEEHVSVANTMHNLAVTVYLFQNRAKEAVAMIRHAVAMDERLVGPDHPNTIRHLHGLAFALDTNDQPEEALEVIERVIPALEKQHGSLHPMLGEAWQTLANVQLKLGRPDEAKRSALKSFEMNEKMLGSDYNSSSLLRMIGRADIALGDPKSAIEPLSKAHAMHVAKKDDPGELAWTTALLGQALYDSGRDRARGRALVQEAERYMRSDARLEVELRELLRWKEKRRLP